ncbi:hypothetical protein [Prevotella sp. KH2C16]
MKIVQNIDHKIALDDIASV